MSDDSLPAPPDAPWTFITNHAQVLLYVVAHPNARVREIAAACGITERRVYRILRELEEGHYVKRTRKGNRLEFAVDDSRALRAPLVRDRTLKHLLELLGVLAVVPL